MNLWRFTALIGVTMVALGLTVAGAQYPAPAGNLTITAPTTNIPAGAVSPIFVSLVDNQNQPLANEPGTVAIELPGPDGVFAAALAPRGDGVFAAALAPRGDGVFAAAFVLARDPTITPSSFTTDSAGHVTLTLDPGGDRGAIRIKVSAGTPIAQGGKGVFAAQLQVQAGGTTAPPNTAGPLPLPPNTGNGVAHAGDGAAFARAGTSQVGVVLLLVAGGAMLTLAAKVRRRRAA